MKTSSFRTFKKPGAISIARSARGFRGPGYPALAPGSWFKSVSRDEYERRYFDQLSKLDPEKVVKDLHDLVHPHEPVLLCWEVPPFTEDNWCHRRMVAAWLDQSLGLSVQEVGSTTQLSIFSAPVEAIKTRLIKWMAE